jgi:hypothetical protein
MSKRRRRLQQTLPLKDRLISFATEAREKAKSMPPGAEKEDLLRRARQADTTSRLDDWINSRGLQSPK